MASVGCAFGVWKTGESELVSEQAGKHMATFKSFDPTPTSTQEQRQQQVDETNVALRLQGIEPDAETQELQRRYIAGEITAHDLIDWILALLRTLDQSNRGHPAISKDLH